MPGKLFSHLSDLLSLSDEQAMLRVQKRGDPRAFSLLVGRWENGIRRFCTRMTGDEHRAEDLAQDVFLRVFASRSDYRPKGCFSSYLWRIAVNLCHDEQRRISRRKERFFDKDSNKELKDEKPLETKEDWPDEVVANREQEELVRDALLQLPEIYRVTVILRHYEGLKFREIAQVEGIAEGTVKSRMAEALTRLKQLLKPIMNEQGP